MIRADSIVAVVFAVGCLEFAFGNAFRHVHNQVAVLVEERHYMTGSRRSGDAFARPLQFHRSTLRRPLRGSGRNVKCCGATKRHQRAGVLRAVDGGGLGDDVGTEGGDAVAQETPPLVDEAARGGSRVGSGRDRASTSPTKKLAAARAAVAVIENRKMKEMEEQGFVRPAETTRDAMVASVRKLEVGALEADQLVKIFVAAIGSALLAPQSQQAKDQEVIVKRFVSVTRHRREGYDSSNELAELSAESATAQQQAERLAELASGEEGAEDMFDDPLFEEVAWFTAPGADEVVAVMKAKPKSTEFSKIVLSRFETWLDRFNLGPKNADRRSPLWSTFQKMVQVDNVELNFQVSGAFQEATEAYNDVAMSDGKETVKIARQIAFTAMEQQYFSELGEPEGNLEVPAADADAFANEILSGWCSLTETVHCSTGVQLIRGNFLDEKMTSEQGASVMRARLAASPLGQRVRAFMVDDRVATFDAVKEVSRTMTAEDGRAMMEEQMEDGLFKAVMPMVDALGGAGKGACFLLVPISAEPVNKSIVGENGLTILSVLAVVSATTFSADAFGINSVQLFDMLAEGRDADVLLKVGAMAGMLFALSAVRDMARLGLGWSRGMTFGRPSSFPSVETGILATSLPHASYPKDGKDLFDVSVAAPVAGFIASGLALVLGLQMTAAASAQAIADFPTLRSELLQSSLFVGSLVDYFLHTQLKAADITAARISLHPLAIAGAMSMLWNAAATLPLPGSPGQNAVVSLGRESPLNGVTSFVSGTLVALRLLRDQGGFLLTVMASNVIIHDRGAPIIQEDNVTPVRDPGRIILIVLTALVSLAVLTPMTVQTFLQASTVDTGAGAASVAAGLGVGGLGFNGLLGP